MSGDLLYLVAFGLLASLVLVPSLLAAQGGLVARWDRRYRQPRFGTRPHGTL